MTRSSLILIFFIAVLFPNAALPAQECPSLMESDPALMAELPPRLRAILLRSENAHLRLKKTQEWSDFHQFLDRVGPQKRSYRGRMGKLTIMSTAQLNPDGVLKIAFPYVGLDRVVLGKSGPGGQDFLQLLAASIDWLARNRKASGIREIRLVGEHLVNPKLAEVLESLNFSKSILSFRCAQGVVVGTWAGYFGGSLGQVAVYGAHGSDEDLPVSRWITEGGALMGFTVGCLVMKTGTSYTLTIRPVDDALL